MKQNIKTIIAEWQANNWGHIADRSLDIPLNTGLIISLIGVRRSGKTSLLHGLTNKLRVAGIPNRNILYINFEDERITLRTADLDLIIQSYYELYPDINMADCYLMFDEIQNIEGWEKFVRRIYDTLTKNIFITGSNAKLLSAEIATALRGRTISYTVYPLSISEFFKFKDVSPAFNTTRDKAKTLNVIRSFLLNGGFPETVNLPDGVRTKLLQSYFNTMIYRDIVERYKISDVQMLKFFLKKILSNISKPISVNKIYNELKSLGYKISNNYLYTFLDYANTIYLSFSVARFSFSEIKQEKSDKKIYVIDTGLLNALEFGFSQNLGKLLENAVALEFLKHGSEITYFKGVYECDFIVKSTNAYMAVQVAYELNDSETEERENRGLAEACQSLNLKTGIIITFEQEKEYEYNGLMFKQIPFYKFFLTQLMQ